MIVSDFIAHPQTLFINGRVVPFVLVDPYCPTIRESYDFEIIKSHRLHKLFFQYFIIKTLITPTDPIKIVLVSSTYPQRIMFFRQIKRTDFSNFLNLVLDPIITDSVCWSKQGF